MVVSNCQQVRQKKEIDADIANGLTVVFRSGRASLLPSRLGWSSRISIAAQQELRPPRTFPLCDLRVLLFNLL
jgi:hypothetical protein